MAASSKDRGDLLDRMRLKPGVANFLRANVLTLATLVGVVIGVILGAVLNSYNAEKFEDTDGWTPREVMYVKFIGNLFLRMLKGIIIPLIVPSLIASVGSLDIGLSGKVGGRAVAYYLVTTVLAVILGIILVSSIRPGVGSEEEANPSVEGAERHVLTSDTLMDLARNCFPPNVVQAMLNQYSTRLVEPNEGLTQRYGYQINSTDKSTWDFKGGFGGNTNMLGLITFSIAVGVAIAVVGEEAKPLLRFFQSTTAVMMQVTTWVICLAPIGVCFLIAASIMQMTDVADTFARLGLYFATVLVGLFIHGCITLPSLFFLVTRTLPFRFMANMGQALTTAWGTSSSSATLPVTIDCLERKNGVDPKVSKFVLPIGATINMDGTALYEAVAAIFISQVRDVDIGFGGIIAISITATAASIGAAGIPQAGLVTMVMVLDTVGLPSEDVALILAVDWLLDRFRTAINVLGDALGAGIVYHLSKDELESLDNGDAENGENLDEKPHNGSNGVGNGVSNDTFEMNEQHQS